MLSWNKASVKCKYWKILENRVFGQRQQIASIRKGKAYVGEIQHSVKRKFSLSQRNIAYKKLCFAWWVKAENICNKWLDHKNPIFKNLFNFSCSFRQHDLYGTFCRRGLAEFYLGRVNGKRDPGGWGWELFGGCIYTPDIPVFKLFMFAWSARFVNIRELDSWFFCNTVTVSC